MTKAAFRKLVILWLVWAVIILGFQQLATARLAPQRPDTALPWTANETGPGSWSGRTYLLDPFLNEAVGWDSEFYLSIATAGYDDASLRAIPEDFTWASFRGYCQADPASGCYSLNYAFFPLYPLAIRALAVPLQLSSLTPIAAATLAGVLVSLLGTLGAMLALYAIALPRLGETGALRTSLYLLIFPSAFFLAQVYTEGLFIGLTFGALALLLQRRWGWSALLATLAVWARPGGALMVLPMIIFWLQDRSWQQPMRQRLLQSLAALAPALSYSLWAFTPLADRFHLVEGKFFGRGLLALKASWSAWSEALAQLVGGSSSTQVYYALEFSAILLAVGGCLWLLRRQPALAVYGLALVAFAMTTGAAQGMVRYVLGVPALFLMLGEGGENRLFDRAWSLLSTLLLALLAMLFAFDFWVA